MSTLIATSGTTTAVVLDIGEEMGSLVIYTPAEMVGAEIEVSPCGHPERRVHVGVWERSLRARPAFAAAFPPLPSGEYDIWLDQPGAPRHATIVGGRVTELHWR